MTDAPTKSVRSREEGSVDGLGDLTSIAGVALLAGLLPPLQWGWLPLAVVLAACWLIHERRGPLRAAWLSGTRPVHRAVSFALVVLPAAVFAAVALRAIASLLIAYPSAHWALGVVVLGAIACWWVPSSRVRIPLALLVTAAALAATVPGTRYETGATHARGWAHSAAVHGIHPFQTTAVIVDGYGPFDLPINDYVEPDGHRGYGPPELADALQRALHDIAEVHFADGPARAKLAFEEATVQMHVDAAVREQLDREPDRPEHPRLLVTSGTFGQRSSVSFVCPGRRDDPRGHPGDNIMNRMCPDKYAAEASAGLGVTGRWPGYTEARGHERLGLAAWLGWTRSDDEVGRQVVRTETLVLGLVGMLALLGVSLPAGGRGGLGLRAFGAVTVVGALGALLVGALQGPAWSMPLAALQDANETANQPWNPLPWLPYLAVLIGLPAFERAAAGARVGRAAMPPRSGRRVAVALLLAVTVAVACHLPALKWVRPALWTSLPTELPMQRFAAGLADAWGEPFGLSILEVEGVVAGALVIVLLGVVGSSMSAAMGAGTALLGPRKPWQGRALGALAVALIGCALVVSRKTEGGAALVPGAIGLTLVLSSCLSLAGRPRPGRVGTVTHLLWIGLALVLVVASALRAQTDHPFVLLCTVVGLVVAVAAVTFLRSHGDASASLDPSAADGGSG